ncbi:Transmembrane ascorbate ferrireductase 2 [Linum perenne]
MYLCWLTTISGTKNLKKLVHLGLQFLALCLSLIGVWAALKFHNDKGIDNFYSLHSWLGVACISLFGIQWDDHHYMNSIMSKSKLARYILDQRLPMAEVLIDHDEEKCDRKSLLTLFGDVVVDPVVFLPMIDNEHWYMVVMSLKEKRHDSGLWVCTWIAVDSKDPFRECGPNFLRKNKELAVNLVVALENSVRRKVLTKVDTYHTNRRQEVAEVRRQLGFEV